MGSSPSCVNALGANMTRAITDALVAPTAGCKRHGVFLDSCFRHCQFGVHPVWMPPVVDGLAPMQAVDEWHRSVWGSESKSRTHMYTHMRRLWVQGRAYPCKECCAV